MPRTSASGLSFASFACFACRKGKRRCDRRLPSCSLCARKGLRCEYTKRRKKRANHHSTSVFGPERPTDRAGSASCQHISQSSQSSLSAIYFLDVAAFKRARLSLQQVELQCNKEVLDMVGAPSFIHATAKIFFTKVHLWMPIVSKSRFYQHLLHPLSKRQTELSLLVLCMRLVSSPFSSSDDSTYQTSKRLYSEMVSAGILSIDILQAGILLALYEVGHAIYPAAFLSIGSCARYGIALDVDKAISHSVVSLLPWNELEERRRVWWAILVLDRFVNFGSPLRPLATKDPDLRCYLPVDDAAWDNGSSKPEDAVTVASGSNLSMGRFARLSQSVRLLTCTLEHVSIPHAGEDHHVTEEAQLRRTLLALVNIFQIEESERRLEFCTQSAVCYSAILILEMYHETLRCEGPLLSFHVIPRETEIALQSVNAIIPRLLGASSERYTSLDYVSPFVLHVIYMAATLHLSLDSAQPSSSHKEEYKALRGALGILNQRWRCAGIYLEILNAAELTFDPQL